MAEFWLKCSACKREIPYGAKHWVCSVSTCNRSRMRLVFCSVICWDIHLADARHRDAGAIEARAPTREVWQRELASSAPPPSAAPQAIASAPASAPVRRVVGEAGSSPSPSPSTSSSAEGVKLVEVTDRDVLIVVSKMKKYIKDRSGMNCSDAVADMLSEHVRLLCDDAIRTAARDERKTVLDRDVVRARR